MKPEKLFFEHEFVKSVPGSSEVKVKNACEI
jgi:hypothetical protein